MTFNRLHELISEDTHRVRLFILVIESSNELESISVFTLAPHEVEAKEALHKQKGVQVYPEVYYVDVSNHGLQYNSFNPVALFEFAVKTVGIEQIQSYMEEGERMGDDTTTANTLVPIWKEFIRGTSTKSIKSQGFENTDDLDAL